MPHETHAPRSALLACWGTAFLAGEVGLAALSERVLAHDEDASVQGLAVDPQPVERALARLRADGVVRLRLVLPAPGDVLGLPGPGRFTTAALAAGEGVLAVRPDGGGTGLVPQVVVHGSAYDGTVTTAVWHAMPVVLPPHDPGPFLHEAEHDLRHGVLEAAAALRDLDVARWRPEVAGALEDLRRQARSGLADEELPGCWPERARGVLVQARQLAGLLALATQDDGAAVHGSEAVARAAVLRELGSLVRRARVAAYNAYRPQDPAPQSP